ncbi:MAG: hypothetical protein HGA35_07810, partial [Erysipelotrichaceae bacterium]|nr:hypothetical protein [Erysipelotrichaceae bacterium]
GISSATVYTASVNTDGTLGAWTTGTSLPGVLSHSQAIVVKNKVYLLSGFNGQTLTYLTTVYTATISSDIQDYSPYYDGTIQPFSSVSTKFKLPDYSSLDKEYCECLASYIKF